MKAVILAGGFGTRISEESDLKPKPMIEIGGKPIIVHIMEKYAKYDINEFIICSGYMSKIIEDYFIKKIKDWEVKVVDTGINTMTGGRLKKIQKYIENETFCFTYGDSLNNANISNIIKLHKQKKSLATVTTCHPSEKYGILKLKNDTVVKFEEKPERSNEWVNAGYFVLEPQIFKFIKNDSTIKDIRKNLIDYLIKNFSGNENFIKIVNSSVFSSNDNIISDNYKITNNEKIAIIPPIGGG